MRTSSSAGMNYRGVRLSTRDGELWFGRRLLRLLDSGLSPEEAVEKAQSELYRPENEGRLWHYVRPQRQGEASC